MTVFCNLYYIIEMIEFFQLRNFDSLFFPTAIGFCIVNDGSFTKAVDVPRENLC